jgi:hypothetical protein
MVIVLKMNVLRATRRGLDSLVESKICVNKHPLRSGRGYFLELYGLRHLASYIYIPSLSAVFFTQA